MQLNVMPENSITLGQIFVTLAVNKCACYNTNYSKQNVFLYSCRRIKGFSIKYSAKTMLRHSKQCAPHTYLRKRVYGHPSWRRGQRQHQKHRLVLDSIWATETLARGCPYWLITPMDQALKGRPCWQFLAAKTMWPHKQNIKILPICRRAAIWARCYR